MNKLLSCDNLAL